MIQQDSLEPAVPSARLLALSVVKNEIDVVELFVRHNLQFLDAMLVIDNGSTDGTREILARLIEEGLPLVIYDDPRAGHLQAQRMTALYANNLGFFAPDYVFMLDADEFLRAESREEMMKALSEIPAGYRGAIPWRTYVLRAEEASKDEILFKRITRRRRTEVPEYSKAVIPWRGPSESPLEIQQGSHEVFRASGERVPEVPLQHVSIAHFPVRSLAQLKQQTIVGWLAHLVMDPRAPASGYTTSWHRREIYKLIVAGRLTPDTVARVSANYAQTRPLLAELDESDLVEDPLVTQAKLQYGRPVEADPLIDLARFAEAVITGGPRRPPTRENDSADAERLGSLRHGLRELRSNILGAVKLAAWTKRRDPSEDGHHESSVRDRGFRGDGLSLDVPPFRHLWDKYRPESVLDLGCGGGGYMARFAEWGASRLQGIDRLEPNRRILCGDGYRVHDLHEPLQLGTTFDLVMCLQVIEYLDSSREMTLLETIAGHARDRILFSAAAVDEPGIGHLNCRPLVYWLDLWESLGFVPDTLDSLAFRSLATFPWLRRNPLVLVRGDSCHIDGPFARADLERLAARPHEWPKQEPATIESPSSVRLPMRHKCGV
jgi:SAM-dependent methyltransferase